jgi:hypothetical protein
MTLAPGLRLKARVAELKEDQHPGDVGRVQDDEVRLQVELGADQLKIKDRF